MFFCEKIAQGPQKIAQILAQTTFCRIYVAQDVSFYKNCPYFKANFHYYRIAQSGRRVLAIFLV
jgi:hypothetical protein